jgi:hypothetical protein
MINCFDLNSGHSPAATSCQSKSLSGQSALGIAELETTEFDKRSSVRRYSDTFLLHSSQDLA